MDFHKLTLFFHTLKHLRFKQLYYRGYYLIRNRFFRKEYRNTLSAKVESINWSNSFLYTDSYKKNNSFQFLNVQHTFNTNIDWNYSSFGKLWTYNLNYFDFLNQSTIAVEDGLHLITDYIKNDAILKDGKEPYPISLRGINWIKFLASNAISDAQINQTLYNHYQILLNNLEYHLLGNHLLENGYALFFGSYYFKDQVLYKKAKQILTEELTEQILKDGAHFELSPMYHQILLHRILDCIRLTTLNPWKDDGLDSFLKEKARNMLAWLQKITFSNGDIPMVNDCAFSIAPTSNQLFNYAEELGLEWSKSELSDSGYRKFQELSYELLVDVGNIGPTYQPGHAHSDTFNFVLYVGGKPIIVDTGTSTYEKNALRQKERETAAHNTVMIANQEQTQVWGGFRVAKRAKITNLIESANLIKASHNGYQNLGIKHTRSFSAKASRIEIIDSLNKNVNFKQVAFFHLHPSIKNVEVNKNSIKLFEEKIQIIFEGALKIQVLPYEYATGFNRREKSQKFVVSFQKTLKTQIKV